MPVKIREHFRFQFVRLDEIKMRFTLKTLMALLLLVAFDGGAALATTFTASLSQDTLTLGEQATLTLTFDGGQPTKLDSPAVPGLKFGTPNKNYSQNIDFNSGQMTSRLTLAYSFAPQREGEFTIPALKAEVDGQKLTTAPLKLTVLKPDAPTAAAIRSGNEVAFMKLVLPQKKVYVGQMLTGQLQIYLRDDVQNYGQPQFTGTPADGLALGKNAGGGQTQTQAGNRVYSVLPISLALTVTKSGKLTLGPFTANIVVVLPSQNQGDNPLAQFGFRSPLFGERKQIPLATEQVTLESLPLPAENVPANFNGVIGDFSMNVTAGPTNVTAGDPVTVRVQISGRGAFDGVKLPDQTGWGDFKLFAPSVKFTPTDQLELSGTKTFEEIVTPQNAGVHELPPFAFSFFNPDDGQYHTLTQPALPLVVRSAGAVPLPNIAANKNAAPENQPPQDILPIKEKLGILTQKKVPLVAQPIFLAAQSLPILAFLAAFIWRKRTDNLANNPRLRRQRAVAQLVRDGLNDLKKFATENQSDEFFALLFRLLQEQLGERLDCPASAITENVIEEHPALRGAAKPTLDSLRELFQLCNQARYAPVRGSSELNSVAAKFEKTAGELQEVRA
jgi:hypothetical protein